MKEYRTIKEVVTGKSTIDGAGVQLVRLFSCRNAESFDPFLMMDAFDNDDPEQYIKGFPWHPHRGIETITYLIEGNVEHGDSLGNKGNIHDGDCQWMTAGSGIIHQEMPQPPGRMVGVQIWLNLPKKDKMTTPAYGDILSENVPEIEDQDCRIRIISGLPGGPEGAFTGAYIKPTFLDVSIPSEGEWECAVPSDYTLYTYTFTGTAIFNPESNELHGPKKALLFTEGQKVKVRAGREGVRFILLAGPRLNEPLACGGPIVMNSREELDLAYRELDAGTFIREQAKR